MKLARWLMGGLVLAVMLLLLLASVWAPDKPVSALSGRWAPSPSRFLALNGMQVHLRDEGPRNDSVPIVLVHGTSASLHTWDGWAASLRPSRRVIRFDLPGFGLTGPSPDNDYSLAAYTRITLQLLDSLGVSRFAIAGNSLGGEVAWHVAAAAPDRVNALILVDAAGYPIASQQVPIGFRMARTRGLEWLFTRILPRAVVESSVRSVYGDPSRVTDSLVTRYYELTLREGNRASLPRRFAQSDNAGDSTTITTLRVPTLIMWGGRDGLIPPDHAGRFARDIAGSRIELFPTLGHVPHEEDPARTAESARAFLDCPRCPPAR
ncbi:alpha/beta fold hydrolase [Gemmatimonas sp.]|uniref:alpha/beta fold hydrolase n=1 Tax=Gemmatimonas sp. TaxID=1962908 RepID=UPI003983BC59